MKYRIVKETYADQTNKFYVQQKSFLFWKPIDDRAFSRCNWYLFSFLEYKLFVSYTSAEKALNDYIRETENNTLIKTEVAATFKTK
jgi:hypothetical protein